MSLKQRAHGSELYGYPIPRRPITFDLRHEPGAGKPHAGICAGGGEQSSSLPRPLFWLWIAGFGAYLLASRIQVGREFAFAAAACFAALWFWHRTPGAEYAVSGYPLFALSFLALAMATQQTTVITLHPWLARPIKFAADYSFSLFLIHFTIEKIIAALWFGPTWAGIVTAVAISNLLSIAFAFACERRYRAVAVYLKQLWIRRSAAPIMTT